MIRVGLIDDDLEHQKMICEFINTYKNETNTNFDTYNSLTPNWYYKVLR